MENVALAAAPAREHVPAECIDCQAVTGCFVCRDQRVAALTRAVRFLAGWDLGDLANADRAEKRPMRIRGDVASCEECGAAQVLASADWHSWNHFAPEAREPCTTLCEKLAAKALKFAQEAAFISMDPLVGDAFETIKVALDTIAGHRRMPIDRVEALARGLTGKKPKDSENATLRALYELVERRRDIIAPRGGGRPRGAPDTEAASLCRDVMALLGDRAALTPDQCRTILVRLTGDDRFSIVREQGALEISGAVAELYSMARAVTDYPAFPDADGRPSDYERRELLQRISKARSLGTARPVSD